ncbi:MAG: cytochrome c-type biogenesis protein CcmH [Actinomycetota bacterium]|nr:cytochrome c-type biogenesis protein CcmH [Actinomycetota bacterium]
MASATCRSVARRWAPWLVIAVVVIVAGAIGLQRASHPSLDQRTLSVAGQVRCPVCNGQSVAQSDAPPSLAIRSQIRSELAAGQAPAEILAGIANSYGPGILEKPRASGVGLVVWLAPVGAVAAAVVGLILAFRRWRPSAVAGTGASDTDRALVGEALSAEPGPVSGPGPRSASDRAP